MVARTRCKLRDEDDGRDKFAKMLLLLAVEELLEAAANGVNVSAPAEEILEWVEMVGPEREQMSLFGDAE